MWGVNRMLGKWIVLIFLFVGALWDIKKKAVPKVFLLIWGIVSVIYFVFEIINGQNVLGLLLGVIPGIITLVLSIVTKEKIGLGDGLILICVGCLQTIKDVLCMIFFSFIFLTVVLIFLLAIRRIGRSSRIPFVPFLFLGQLITMYGGIL